MPCTKASAMGGCGSTCSACTMEHAAGMCVCTHGCMQGQHGQELVPCTMSSSTPTDLHAHALPEGEHQCYAMLRVLE